MPNWEDEAACEAMDETREERRLADELLRDDIEFFAHRFAELANNDDLPF